MGWNALRRWREDRVLRRHPIAEGLWRQCAAVWPAASALGVTEMQRLRELTTLFLYQKALSGARDFALTETMRVSIAMQACLPVLNLGLSCYDGWHEVIVYPDSFVVERDEVDGVGVVHASRQVLSGESWGRGPLLVAWSEADPLRRPPGSAHNVVIHEAAHKLDMQNGAVNGMPPLHRGMSASAWFETFSTAYAYLQDCRERHVDCGIDSYAAESPAEFFAVVSECFFEAPQVLRTVLPPIYVQLRLYYHQDPAARRADRI